MASIEIRNITKTYQASEGKILDGISLSVRDGDMAFLLGPSGCGKSTLLRILAGLISADGGQILLDGKDISSLPPEKRNMPMVFQNYALWPHMDVYDNIAFGLKMTGLARSAIDSRVKEMLATVQMESFIHRKVPSLSGGQQQRIALARALAMEPAVLLLDEPLSNLDAKLRDTMRFEIRRICKERHLTAIYVTHDRKEALSMADLIAVLEHGTISQQGTPRDIYLRPQNRFTASFLGDINFIEGEFLRKDGGKYVFKTSAGELAALQASREPEQGRAYTLAFRPEAVRCEGTLSGENVLNAVIDKSAFLGESSYHTVRLDGGAVISINEFSAAERADGSRIAFQIPPDRISILEK